MSENLGQLAINQARENGGKLEVISKVKVEDKRELSIYPRGGVSIIGYCRGCGACI
ncbi:TPA: hypothetical protein U4Q29_000312 [Streptococcus agalactiae]|nr:hypothetical protein [Streptococcus agalactiae]